MNAQGFFRFGDRVMPYAANEGERAVEIPIARLFYERHRNDPRFVELGAVTPYWWGPGGIEQHWTVAPVDEVPHRVVDPYDAYPKAERAGILDLDLAGAIVMSISTIEHVGMGDYGDRPVEPHRAVDALRRITISADTYLVTWPTGHNRALDDSAQNVDEMLRASGAGGVRGFQFEQFAPHEYRLRDDFNWHLPYGAPSSPLPYGSGVVFLTDDPELLAMAAATPR